MPAYTQNTEVEDDTSHQKISSLFLGPRAENFEYLKSNLITILEEHQDTRLDYFPKDGVSTFPLSAHREESVVSVLSDHAKKGSDLLSRLN